MKRRAVLGVLAGGIIAVGYFGLVPAPVTIDVITPQQALEGLRDGKLLLVDIRRPDEWRGTGVATGARLIDMRAGDFLEQVEQATGGDRSMPIALICARGVRSYKTAARLMRAGYTVVLDVSEGMLGTGGGAGWIAAGLPLSPYTGE
ncbi:MAG: rhodanese-like domain-containing protein [Albidovulum sp.]